MLGSAPNPAEPCGGSLGFLRSLCTVSPTEFELGGGPPCWLKLPHTASLRPLLGAGEMTCFRQPRLPLPRLQLAPGAAAWPIGPHSLPHLRCG